MEKVNCTNCGTDNSFNAKYCKSCGYTLPKIAVENLESPAIKTMTASKSRLKRLAGPMAGVLAVILSSFAVQHFFFKAPTFDTEMTKAASELNKACPIMLDAYTRFDNAVAMSDNTFQYNYTIINVDKKDVNLDTMKMKVEPGIINNIKTNPDMKVYRDHDVTFIYSYRDKDGVFITKYTVTPDRYK